MDTRPDFLQNGQEGAAIPASISIPPVPPVPTLAPLRRSSSHPKPTKGILKNATTPSHTGQASPFDDRIGLGSDRSLQWDEENLALTEIQKDSLMKITEPKTPFVRYNAETDTVEGDIPNFDLGGDYTSEPEQTNSPIGSSTRSLSPTNADASGVSSRRTSVSSVGRSNSAGGGSVRSGSSSRSTSFNLPTEAKKDIKVDSEGQVQGEEVEEEEEMSEEAAAAKHAAFVRARGMHYSNEAEAMKRAAQLMDDEEEESRAPSENEEGEERGRSTLPPIKMNGIKHG